MNKLLQNIDRFIIKNIVKIHLYAMLITLATTSLKVFKLVNYSWLIAFSPAFIAIFIVGFVNFLLFLSDRV